jgi:hypothetical protein
MEELHWLFKAHKEPAGREELGEGKRRRKKMKIIINFKNN